MIDMHDDTFLHPFTSAAVVTSLSPLLPLKPSWLPSLCKMITVLISIVFVHRSSYIIVIPTLTSIVPFNCRMIKFIIEYGIRVSSTACTASPSP